MNGWNPNGHNDHQAAKKTADLSTLQREGAMCHWNAQILASPDWGAPLVDVKLMGPSPDMGKAGRKSHTLIGGPELSSRL